ncbi:MAG: antitoxin VapB family protein [Thermoplasmata archaeon]
MPTTKTIALDLEAYELLRRQKREGESFSDTVKRLSQKRRSILDFAGAWKDMPVEDLEQIREFLRRGRELDLRRMEDLIKRMR